MVTMALTGLHGVVWRGVAWHGMLLYGPELYGLSQALWETHGKILMSTGSQEVWVSEWEEDSMSCAMDALADS